MLVIRTLQSVRGVLVCFAVRYSIDRCASTFHISYEIIIYADNVSTFTWNIDSFAKHLETDRKYSTQIKINNSHFILVVHLDVWMVFAVLPCARANCETNINSYRTMITFFFSFKSAEAHFYRLHSSRWTNDWHCARRTHYASQEFGRFKFHAQL